MRPHVDPDELLSAVIELFARVPALPQKLLDLVERNIGPDQIPAFFHHIFVGSSHPAPGANYNVIGYRLRDVNEMDSVVRAHDRCVSNFGFHLVSPTYEITTEMIEAGSEVLAESVLWEQPKSEIVEAIYRAMREAQPRVGRVP